MVGTDVAKGRSKITGYRFAGLGLVVLGVLGSSHALVSNGGVAPSMRTEATSYQPEGPVEFELRNGLRTAGHNPCFAYVTLQVHDGDGWVTVTADLGPPTGELVACTGELRPLPPLGRAHSRVHLPPDLPSGEYRLVHELEIGGDRRAVATAPFTVGVDG